MGDSLTKPVILAFAGPNGSGKTTVAKNYPKIGVYINADEIKKEYGVDSLKAAQIATQIRNDLVGSKKSFSFETVLSTDRNLKLMQTAKANGYEVQCIYVLTVNPDINAARVKSRVLSGGHDVPVDKIYSRYEKALKLLPDVIKVCDKILVFDNSIEPVLIYEKYGDTQKIYPNELWSEKELKLLTNVQ